MHSWVGLEVGLFERASPCASSMAGAGQQQPAWCNRSAGATHARDLVPPPPLRPLFLARRCRLRSLSTDMPDTSGLPMLWSE